MIWTRVAGETHGRTVVADRAVCGVDYDDTLAMSNEALIALHNERYGTSHEVGPDSYDLPVLWGVSRDEVERRFMEYVESVAHDRVEALPHARKVLQVLSERFDIALITGRLEETERRTRVWLNAVTPGVFSDLVFTNQFSRVPGKVRTKGHVCIELKVDVFIEDSASHAIQVVEHSPKTRVLLLDTIWNQGFKHPRIERVPSWKHLPRLLGL